MTAMRGQTTPPMADVEAALFQWKQRVRERARGTVAPEEMADLLATVTALVDAAVEQERVQRLPRHE